MASTCQHCESCEQLVKENELLRKKIDELSGAESLFPRVRWLVLFGVGWLAITIVPIVVCSQLELDTDDWIGYVAYGWAFAAPWAQWSILITLIVLVATPIWRRLLFFCLASLGLAVCWGTMIDYDAIDVTPLVDVAPIAASLIAIPVFACRVFRRWQIMQRSDLRDCEPVSIATYLVLTLVAGILASVAAWLPLEMKETWTGVDALLFASPLVACIMITIASLRFFLRKVTVARFVIWLLFFALACCASAAGPYIFATFQSVPSEAASYAVFGAGWAVAFSFWFVLAVLWMRSLGYRLRP